MRINFASMYPTLQLNAMRDWSRAISPFRFKPGMQVLNHADLCNELIRHEVTYYSNRDTDL